MLKARAILVLHKRLGWFVGLFLFGACGVGNDPGEVAEAFCRRYFIEMNQSRALELANGLAAEKLRQEIELLKGAARAFEGGESEFHRLKPYTDYKLTARTDKDEAHVLFIYQITIEARHDTTTMRRELVLNTVRNENGRWTVSNFDLAAR
jgi:hypothetical protein